MGATTRGWTILTVTLLIGVVTGAMGSRFIVSMADSYIHTRLGVHAHVSDATVTKKQREQDRVLVRVQANDQPVLLTFTKRVAEIDLLVEPGDVITLALPDNQTFVEDPSIERVRRPGPSPARRKDEASQ